MAYEYETIKIQQDDDGVTWLIFNRPEKRNAMSPQLHADCNDALYNLATDAKCRVLIITGAGDAFCAGQDLRLFFRGTDNAPRERFEAAENSHQWRWTRLSKFPKPTIAMVNGFCFGGAFTQLIACDLAVAGQVLQARVSAELAPSVGEEVRVSFDADHLLVMPDDVDVQR